MRFIFIIISFLFFTNLVLAQDEGSVTMRRNKPRADTNYIKSYKDYLALGIFIAAPVNTLTLTPKDSLIKPTEYKTNLSSVIGFTGAYKSVTASIGFRIPVEPDLTSKYGTTKFKAFAIGTQKTKFSVRFDYRKVAGFYNGDSLIKIPGSTETYFKRSDVESRQFMVSGLYNFSWKKYSYQSSFNFSEHQLKTRVGFIMKSSISFNRLNSDSSLINLNQTATNQQKVQQLNYTSFLIGPGMGLNVVIAKRVYFSMMLFLSFDYVSYAFVSNDNSKTRNESLTGFFEGRMALGYHSKRFYAGLKFVGDKVAVQTTDYKVENLFGAVTLDVGYRFNAPGILKKVYENTFTKFLGL
ncbi:MAG: DUF4421 domain-containing protein [Cytophaga sp.]|uniref:DUF4421 domain-containing protein n=1 Tax=Cytophaga sp. TaxID=29535 RepID=UPI003F7FE124